MLPTRNSPPTTTPPPSGRCLLHQVAFVPERLVNRQPPRPRKQNHQEPRYERQLELSAYPATISWREQPDVYLNQEDVPGGIPLRRDGDIVGAIGVSTGTVEQDQEVAEAGAAAF